MQPVSFPDSIPSVLWALSCIQLLRFFLSVLQVYNILLYLILPSLFTNFHFQLQSLSAPLPFTAYNLATSNLACKIFYGFRLGLFIVLVLASDLTVCFSSGSASCFSNSTLGILCRLFHFGAWFNTSEIIKAFQSFKFIFFNT